MQDEERLLLHYVTVSAEQKTGNSKEYQQYIRSFKSQIEVDEDDLWKRINQVSADGAPQLYRAAIIASAVDGKITKKELELLKVLAKRLGLQHSEDMTGEIKRQWK